MPGPGEVRLLLGRHASSSNPIRTRLAKPVGTDKAKGALVGAEGAAYFAAGRFWLAVDCDVSAPRMLPHGSALAF